MAVSVELPSACSGATTGMLASLAALLNSAFALSMSPGLMAPPRYAPRWSTTSMFVAVPKSTTMTGAPYVSTAAIALAMRSAPTVEGSGMSMGMP